MHSNIEGHMLRIGLVNREACGGEAYRHSWILTLCCVNNRKAGRSLNPWALLQVNPTGFAGRHCTTPSVGSCSQVDTGGFASVADVTEAPLRRMDKMESFWLAGAGWEPVTTKQGLGVLRIASCVPHGRRTLPYLHARPMLA